MRPLACSSPAFFMVAVAVAAGAFACTPSQTGTTTTVTSADVPHAPHANERQAPAADTPPGQLVCRTRSVADGTTELFLDWSGTSAKGVLRTVAPSGETYVQTVQAERFKGMIIADDVLSTDLVVHAATVREQNGKQYLRLGDWRQHWSACE